MSKSTSEYRKFIKTASNEQLLEELRQCLRVTAEAVRRMAMVWNELVERGVDVSAYKTPLLAHLPAIASGSLDPEVLVRYGHRDDLINAAAQLVPEEQKKLLEENAAVPVVVRRVDGPGYETKPMRPSDLKASQVRQVFGDGRIRTPSEQKRHLAPAITSSAGTAKVHPARSIDLYSILTPSQIKELEEEARMRSVTPALLIKSLLLQAGLITDDSPIRKQATPERRPTA